MVSFLKSQVRNFFNFNNPYGACEVCEGFGNVMDIDRGSGHT